MVVVLHEAAVDDLHLCNHYGDLLERLLKKTKNRALLVGGERQHRAEGSSPLILQQDQQRPVVGHFQAFDDEFVGMDAIAPDWSEWLAFQSDPTFAAFYTNKIGDGITTSRGD